MKTITFSGLVSFSTRLEVASFPHNLKQNILILESDPKQGYFSERGFPEKVKSLNDHHLFVVSKKPDSCFEDQVFRHTCQLNKKHNLKLRVAPGTINFMNEVHQCIRINFNFINYIDQLIEALQKSGIEFVHNRNVQPYISFIQFKKFVEFKKIATDIFEDGSLPKRVFIKIASDIEYSLFEQMIKDVRNNSNFKHFDASLVYVPQKCGLLNMVSIYCKDYELENLIKIQAYFNRFLQIRFQNYSLV